MQSGTELHADNIIIVFPLKVLASFRTLHEARKQVFVGDIEMLSGKSCVLYISLISCVSTLQYNSVFRCIIIRYNEFIYSIAMYTCKCKHLRREKVLKSNTLQLSPFSFEDVLSYFIMLFYIVCMYK